MDWFYTRLYRFLSPLSEWVEITFNFTVLFSFSNPLHEWSLKKKFRLYLRLKSFNGFSLPLRYHPDSLLWCSHMMLVNCLLPFYSAHLPSLQQMCPRLHHTRQLTAFVCVIPIVQAELPSRSFFWILLSTWLLPSLVYLQPHGIVCTGLSYLSVTSLSASVVQGPGMAIF